MAHPRTTSMGASAISPNTNNSVVQAIATRWLPPVPQVIRP